MTKTLVLQGNNINAINLDGFNSLEFISKNCVRIQVNNDFKLSKQFETHLTDSKIDYGILPDLSFSEIGLIVSDMDSTLITIECIDEIAAGANLKDKVAEITEKSMSGKLNFTESLHERVALLKGLDEIILQDVYDNVLTLTEGAETLISECKIHNIKFMLVSGGFTFFTERLKKRLSLDYAYANTLEVMNGKLTGKLLGPIIDSTTKADLLNQKRLVLGLSTHQVIAVGDGANDINMFESAGFGIAFHAKKKAKAHADLCINFNGLDAVRGWFR